VGVGVIVGVPVGVAVKVGSGVKVGVASGIITASRKIKGKKATGEMGIVGGSIRGIVGLRGIVGGIVGVEVPTVCGASPCGVSPVGPIANALMLITQAIISKRATTNPNRRR